MLSFSHSTASTQKLARLYAVTVTAIATLSVTGQVLTQRALSTQSKDAHTINIAGRQRMLSQSIAKNAYAMQPLSSGQYAEFQEQLTANVDLFERSHQGLQFGSDQLSLSHQNSTEVAVSFAELEPHYEAILTAAQMLLRSNVVSQTAIAQIAAHESDFLIGMNNIVLQYEQEAVQRVSRLKSTQKVLLGLMLLSLLPVLIPIRQVTRCVEDMLKAIQQSSAQLSESALHVADSNEQIEVMAAEQSTTSTQITASSKEIATVAQQLRRAISQIWLDVQQTKEQASQGEQEIDAIAQAVSIIEETTHQVDEQLETICQRAQAIDQVVLTMTKVSDQINLLSLNAAIEAENAGAAGAGFRVVAQEIQRLSDKSAIATLEIEAIVKDMQSAVGVGVEGMDKLTQQTNQGLETTTVAAQQLSVIISSVKALFTPLSQVKQGVESQAESAAQITEAMTQLSIGTRQTVESLQENSGALVQLQAAAEQLQEAA